MRNKPTPLIYKIHKPKGASSFSVIARLKKEFPKEKSLKMGHFGTLDPFAEGLLLVGVYGATRLNQYVQKEFSKTYEAIGILGQKTTTGDIEGEIEKEFPPLHLQNYTIEDFKKILEPFLGEYLQAPPIFSAAKFKGKKLYEYALKGESVEKSPVKRFIYNLEVIKFDYPYLTFRAKVSSGTYIRTLFEDIATALGTIGHLKELKRTSIGDLDISSALDIDGFNREQGMALDEVFPLPAYSLDTLELRKFCCGNNIKTCLNLVQKEKYLWIYDENKSLIGMGELRGQSIFPVWVFAQNAVS